MARRKGFLHELAKAQRAAEKQRERVIREQTKAAKEAERAQRAYLRAQEQAARASAQAQKAYTQEQARLYIEARIAQVALQNEQLEEDIEQLQGLLTATLSVDDYFDLETLKQKPQVPLFDPGVLAIPSTAPTLELPPELSRIQKLLPGAKSRYDLEVAKAKTRYEAELDAYHRREATRQERLAEARSEFERELAEAYKQAAEQHEEVEQLKRELISGTPASVINYFALVLEASAYPDGFPQHARLAYVPESKQLVIEYDLPTFDVVPEIGTYKYVKAKDEVTTTTRPVTQRKALYASVVAQVTLRTLHELFEADRQGHLETIVFNGYVDSVDPGTGRDVRTCVVTVRTNRDAFAQLDLSRVDPIACLKTLNASVSKSPAELAPVRPVLEFNMVDPRFIEETDVLSSLDQRPNLMELSPSEFESLITNLFEKMGLETRQTQASRDGGVDCVAYDPRPIFGGKVVIQAKRYKNTVGVSAVRDLFGTVQNEGASKGILVTTSGYGKAAFEFADGKPLELLSGSNLLYLLAEHAGIEAKIDVPESWKDPQPD
jgi:restriction system protein